MIEWREREHEDIDRRILNNVPSMAALRNCGLVKFFEVPGMRAQPALLQYLIGLWDVDLRIFRVGDLTLTLEIDDIYFLTGLSRRGAPINLVGKRPSAISAEALLAEHGIPGAVLKSGKIPISSIGDLPLQAVLYSMTRVAGSAATHQVSKALMLYALECMEPRVFNWCDAMLRNILTQLTNCRKGQLKDFGYGSIIVSFFLERVPVFRPQLIEVERPRPREPRMRQWVDIMARHGGGPVFTYPTAFFQWLEGQIILIDDYAYAGTDFRNDPDMVLPPGSRWDVDLGKKNPFCYFGSL